MPIAFFISNPKNIIAGTMIVPPPMPKTPAKIPAIIP